MGKVLYPGHFPASTKYPPSSCHSAPLGTPSLEDLMAVYWRIRRWKVSVTFFTGCLPPAIPSLSFDFYFDSEAEKEEDLVCGSRLISNPANSSFGGGTEMDVRVDPCTGPKIRFTCLGDEDCYFFNGSNVIGLGACVDPSQQGTPTRMDLPLYQSVLIDFYSIGASYYGSGAIIDFIGPDLWWSYGGTYDTATGLPL